MSDELEHYAALGLPPGAPPAQVRARFRFLAKQLHPDLHGGDARHHEQFRRIHAAYEFLADSRRKAAYDTPVLSGYARPASGNVAPNAPGSVWVHTSASSPAVLAPTGLHTDYTHRHPHKAVGRAARARFLTALTWSLTAAALSLFGAMQHRPAKAVAVLTMSAPKQLGRPLTAIPPPADGMIALSSVPTLQADTVPASSRPFQSIVIDPPAASANVVPNQSLIDPRATGIDPRATSIDLSSAAVSPQYAGIDSPLTIP